MHQEKTYEVIGACFEVYNQLGNGFLEIIYKECLQRELIARRVLLEREKQIEIYYKGKSIGKKYVIDFLIEQEIILEIKAVNEIVDSHVSQTLNYIKGSGKRIGLLVNFGPKRVEYKRLII